jgi:cephalosporin-C deacetylase-like acetyl esterase
MTPPPVHMAVAGFAVPALFPRYHGLNEEERRLPHGTKLTYGVTDRERFSYRGGYMDCIRGVDFLASRPEVDPEAMIVYPERAHTGDTDFHQLALAWMKRYLAV